MINNTPKPRSIVVEKIDFRVSHKIKRDIFRIVVGNELPLEISPDEMEKLVKIARSYRKNKKERNPKEA